MSATPAATPTIYPTPYGIERIVIDEGLEPDGLVDRLQLLPETVLGMRRKQVAAAGNLVNVVYILGEETTTPRFGMIVAIKLRENEIIKDADITVQRIERERWGDPKDHNLSASNPGSADAPAFREFWRLFQPGQFVLPGVPIYFLIFYRSKAEYAFMVIGSAPDLREGVTKALAEMFVSDSA